MPILKHAKKKLKQDKKRSIKNKKIKDTFKLLVKKAKAEKSAESLSLAFSAVDKAAKKNILNKNKAARMKSALSKQMSSDATPAATSAKKAAPKKESKPKATKASAAKATKSTGAKKTKPSSKK
ncbi:MAG TPA: 30S ribosomal protein S20 [Candidatus Saccharimonadales bacterium]|nr:30S ribosomal protein S20 [Candidatus Saccharimonadales bacterium]